MEIQRYILILKSRKWVVILAAIVTLAVAVLATISMAPTYSASALVRVTTGLSGSVTYTDMNYSERLIRTYVQLLESRPFMEEVTKRLGLHVRSGTLADMIKVESLMDTELIKIDVESANPQQAAAIANTLADLLVEQGQKMYYGQGKSAREILQEQVTVLEEQLRRDRALLVALSSPAPASRQSLDSPLWQGRRSNLLVSPTPTPNQGQDAILQELTTRIHAEEQTYATLLSQYDKARLDEAMRANSIGIVEPAVVPEAPSKPNTKLNLALGALLGLLGGIGLAFLLENFSPLIRSRDDLERAAGAPLLGRIPDFEIRAGGREKPILLNNGNGQSPAAEAFRVLGASTLAVMTEAHLKTILFSSAVPGVGKSTVVANLAVVMAEAGRQVIVVDGDLRCPRLHQFFGVANEPGLSDLLLDPGRLDLAVQPTLIKDVRVIAAGSTQAAPTEHLSAPVIFKIMSRLANKADVVLWDSPPLLSAADAALLAPLADGVVFIVEHAQTQQEAVQAACRQLVDLHAKLIGVIVNRAQTGSRHYYYQRPPMGEWWARMLKGVRSGNLDYRGKEIFHRKTK